MNIQPNQGKINYTKNRKEIMHVIARKISSILLQNKSLCKINSYVIWQHPLV